MNWKKLGKLMLVFALVVATFSSSLLAASAVENGDSDHDEKPFGDNTSPRDIITDEVDDSTIINGDGGGTGSGNSSNGSNGHTHNWRFFRFHWHGWTDLESADGEFTCADCPDANTDTGYRVEFVKADITVENNVYTATIPASRSLDGKKHTDSHTHKWSCDGFEWEMTDEGLKAFVSFHCVQKIELNSCPGEREVEATVSNVPSQPHMCKATLSAAQSPDGKEHTEYYDTQHPVHEWIFDWFELDFSEHNWRTNKGVKGYAVYYCRLDRSDVRRVQAEISAAVTPIATIWSASISAENSLDGESHSSGIMLKPSPATYSDLVQWTFGRYPCTFEGFEWDTTDGVKATAIFYCEHYDDPELESHLDMRHLKVPATVTKVEGTVHTYTATVEAEKTPDLQELSETKSFHEFVFQGFEWDLDNFTAKALFTCPCGEECRVNASMSYPYGNVAKAYVSKYVTPDHEAHEESRIVDFGDYVPYTWNIDGFYEFIGFEWTGTKADACYYYNKRVGCGAFAKEVVKVPAVVTRLTITVIPQYKARIAAWQTPDGVEHTEIKTIILPPTPPVLPDPVPVTPIVGPIEKREINPNLVIWPIGELTPANP